MANKIRVGTDNFAKLLLKSDVFVDKSLFIKEFLEDGGDVVLITRPRRWGKSMNMDMLARFFAIEVDEQGTPLPEEERFNRKLFAGGEVDLGLGTGQKKQLKPLKISEHNEIMAGYQGQFPVISIGLKSVEGSSYEEIVEALKTQVMNLYAKHRYLEKYSAPQEKLLTDVQKEKLKHYFQGPFNEEDIKSSLLFLSELLYKHFGKRVYVLIDEYDTPIHSIYLQVAKENPAQLEKVLKLFRRLFGDVFKSDEYLEKGLITGILRIAKAGLFSGINNLSECSLLDKHYCSSYGFTEAEVAALMQQIPIQTTPEEMGHWYNGYSFGGQSTRMYNPWSIMSCLRNEGVLDHYWIDSGGTGLVDQALLGDNVQEDLQALVAGESIELAIAKDISFMDINKPKGLFSLLLFSGYLNPVAGDAARGRYQLAIPNHEVQYIYEERVQEWVQNKLHIDDKDYGDLITLFEAGDFAAFKEELQKLLAVAASFFQTGRRNGEVFYNGFMFCLLTFLSPRYISERESGTGRPDVMLIPKIGKKRDQAFIIEYKVRKEVEDLEAEAKSGLAQIVEKHYLAKVKEHTHVKSIWQVSMAFCGKDVALAYEREEIL